MTVVRNEYGLNYLIDDTRGLSSIFMASNVQYLVIGCAYPDNEDSFFEKRYFNGRQNISNLIYERRLLSGLEKLSNAKVESFCVPHVGVYPFESKKMKVGFDSINGSVHPVNYNSGFWCKHRSQERSLFRALSKWRSLHNGETELRILICEAYLPYLRAVDRVFGSDKNAKKVVIVPDVPDTINNASIIRKILKHRYLFITNKFLEKADGFVLFSPAMRTLLPYANKPSIVSLGLSNPSQITRTSTPGKIVYAGKLDDMNGICELVDAMAYVQDPRAELFIYGNGRISINTSNPRVHFMGFRSYNDLIDEIADAHVRVCLRKDGRAAKYSFPSKLVDALSSNSIVIANALESFTAEILDQVVIVQSFNPKDIAFAIDEALSMDTADVDRGLIRREFSPIYLAKRISSLFDKLANV